MTRWKSLFIFPLVLELAACGQIPSNQIGRNFTIFIEMTGGEHTSLDADTTGETLARGVSKGAATGGSTGVAVALLCGPWFWACLPIAVGAGVAAGGGVGATAGFVGLSEETARNLNDMLVELDDQREFRQELFDTIIASIPENDLETRTRADVLAKVSINRVEVRQHLRGKISIGVSAKVDFTQLKPSNELYDRLDSDVSRDHQCSTSKRRPCPDRKPAFVSRDHQCSTPKRDAKEWLKDEKDSIDRGLTDCLNTISESITKMLMKVLHGKSWQG